MSWGAISNTFTESRRTTLRWIALGLTSAIVANVAAWLYWPRVDPILEPVDRLLLAIQCCAGIGFVDLRANLSCSFDSNRPDCRIHVARPDDNLVYGSTRILGRLPTFTECSRYRYGLDHCNYNGGCGLVHRNLLLMFVRLIVISAR